MRGPKRLGRPAKSARSARRARAPLRGASRGASARGQLATAQRLAREARRSHVAPWRQRREQASARARFSALGKRRCLAPIRSSSFMVRTWIGRKRERSRRAPLALTVIVVRTTTGVVIGMRSKLPRAERASVIGDERR